MTKTTTVNSQNIQCYEDAMRKLGYKVQLIIIARFLVQNVVLGPLRSPNLSSTSREEDMWRWDGCSTVVGRWLSFTRVVSLGVTGLNSSWLAGICVCSMVSGPSNSSGACSSTWGTGLDSWMTSSSGFGSFLKKELLRVTSFWSVVLLAVILDPLSSRIVNGTGSKRGPAGDKFQWWINFQKGTSSSVRRPNGWQGLRSRFENTVSQPLSGFGWHTRLLSTLLVSFVGELIQDHWGRRPQGALFPSLLHSIRGQCHWIV